MPLVQCEHLSYEIRVSVYLSSDERIPGTGVYLQSKHCAGSETARRLEAMVQMRKDEL